MAIALDATARDQQSSVDHVTYDHTYTGSDRVVWIGALAADATAYRTITGVHMSSGNPATEFVTTQFTTTGGLKCTYGLYYGVAPPAGTQQISVFVEIAVTVVIGDSASYTGVRQTLPVETGNPHTESASTSWTYAVNPLTQAGCWALACVANAAVSQVATSGCVARIPTSGSGAGLFDSNGTIPINTNTTFIVGGDGSSQNWGGIMVAFAPSVTPGGKLILIPGR